jgi:exonuclease III
MKRQIIVVLLLAAFSWPVMAANRDSLLVMFWNLENMFDSRDDSTSVSASDAEFSSSGRRHWTGMRLQRKCNAISKAIFWVSDWKGRMPDAIGVAEVENEYVLWRLVNSTLLRKYEYKAVHFDSPDPRGIDVGLLYIPSRLKLIGSKPLRIGGKEFSTRDILLAEFNILKDTVAMLVNHHPSKYGGSASSSRRIAAMRVLADAADSLRKAGIKNIIAMGDFNDTPENRAFRLLDGILINLAVPLAEKGQGTIRYNGKWELIDMFMVSENLGDAKMEVLHIPFLAARDNAHSGEKPARTFSGPRYIGGVSDHCPIMLDFHLSCD